MKKLIFSGTGYPVSIKTLEYLQDNTLNTISAFAKSKENYEVVWGMDLHSNETQIKEGAFIFNGEIIPFLGADIVEGSTITINEIIENDSFNTNPSQSTAVEVLPAYSKKIASIGTGGLHTFPVASLKRYKQQMIIASGTTIDESKVGNNGSFEGVVFCSHRKLTTEELGNSMIIYTLTRNNGTTSYTAGAAHNLLYRFEDRFAISVSMPLSTRENPLIQWQIVRFK